MARPRLHDDALRRRLLEVTSEAIAEVGASRLTVRDAAARAGTSASAVYSLFGSRELLVRAVGDEAFARFAARLDAVPRTGDPNADLLALGVAYRANAIAEPSFYRVMFGTAGAGARDPARGGELDVATFGALLAAVDAVLAARGEPTGTARTREHALALWGLVHGLVSLELEGLLPGDEAQREARFVHVIGTAGTAILAR
jgi:AcrR family transcriptional regulator